VAELVRRFQVNSKDSLATAIGVGDMSWIVWYAEWLLTIYRFESCPDYHYGGNLTSCGAPVSLKVYEIL
jgi:hypothetical protein